MRTFCALGLLLIACTLCAWPQAVTGGAAVVVTVVDNWGDGLPDTALELFNDSLGIHFKLPSTDDGLFHFAGLPPGAGYRVHITRKDFQTWNSEDFELFFGVTRSFKVALTPIAAPAQRPTVVPSAQRPPAPPPAPPGAIRSAEVPSVIANQARVFPGPTPQQPATPTPTAPAGQTPAGQAPAASTPTTTARAAGPSPGLLPVPAANPVAAGNRTAAPVSRLARPAH